VPDVGRQHLYQHPCVIPTSTRKQAHLVRNTSGDSAERLASIRERTSPGSSVFGRQTALSGMRHIPAVRARFGARRFLYTSSPLYCSVHRQLPFTRFSFPPTVPFPFGQHWFLVISPLRATREVNYEVTTFGSAFLGKYLVISLFFIYSLFISLGSCAQTCG